MIYVVQRGDTLAGVAAAFGLNLQLLILENGITAPDRLTPGQALLVLLPRRTHTVQAGDTLYGIGRAYGSSLRQLYRLNPWLNGLPELNPGQVIVLEYEQEPRGSLVINGYCYTYIDIALLRGVLPYLTAIQPFTYGFTAEGYLIDIDDREILQTARAVGTQALMVVAPLNTEGGFGSDLITATLNNPEANARLREAIVQRVLARNYIGADLDFEYVRAEDAQVYESFATQLGQRLRQYGRILSLALAPKYYAEQRGLLYEGHDYRALGAAADLTLLMTYEWGYTYGPPLAVAPLYEVRRVLEYGLTEIPAQKIIMGLPNYGYDWVLPYEEGRAARSLSTQQALDLAWLYGAEISYDESAQAPWFRYTTPEGVRHEVWFEDVRSLQAKLDLAAELGIRGVGFWTVNRPFTNGLLLLGTQYEPQVLP